MLKNSFVIAFRSLKKKLGFSAINIVGLSVGITCCILIMMYVSYETSFDNFHKNSDNIYRIALDRYYPDRETSYALIPNSLPDQMTEDLPEVIQSTYFFPMTSITYRYDDKIFDEERAIYADSNFFNLITTEILVGNPDDMLRGPNKLVLTESTAQRYFGNEDPVGKSLITSTFNNGETQSWVVTGLIKDYPAQSHLEFDMIGSNNGLMGPNENWVYFNVMSYVELEPGVAPALIEEKIPDMIKTYGAGHIQRLTGQSYEDYIAAGHGYHYYLQPIKDIHLSSNLNSEIKPNSSWSYIYILVSIAAFIMLIACINFTNLSTARSTERAKEVGLRKVMGSSRKLLIYQFIAESVLLSIISSVLSLITVTFVLPYYRDLTGTPITVEQLLDPVILFATFLMALMIGVLAGIYPAFILSSFTPVRVLKGKFLKSSSGVIIRNGLVVFQFAISIILISATLIIQDQVDYLLNKPLGFDKEQVIILNNTFNLQERAPAFKKEINRHPNVVSAAYSAETPGDVIAAFAAQFPNSSEAQIVRRMLCDEDALNTLNIPIIEGRGFQKEFNDSLSILINRTAQNVMNISDPIGKKIKSLSQNDPDVMITYTIVGVVEDFHFESLHTDIGSMVFVHSSSELQPSPYGNLGSMVIKVNENQIPEALAELEATWQSFMPNIPFNYFFLDQRYETFYTAERTSGVLIAVFTVLSIVIACIGLFGLAAYTTTLKIKEIGIRKVLGASSSGIIFMLSQEFTKLVLMAILVAVPITFFGMNQWLEDFAFRIDISPLTFIMSAGVALLITIGTVSYQSYRAATSNPVNSLRSE